jgi:hypothetical protein
MFSPLLIGGLHLALRLHFPLIEFVRKAFSISHDFTDALIICASIPHYKLCHESPLDFHPSEWALLAGTRVKPTPLIRSSGYRSEDQFSRLLRVRDFSFGSGFIAKQKRGRSLAIGWHRNEPAGRSSNRECGISRV